MTERLTDEALLPCPFCGKAASISYMPADFGEPGIADPSMALIGCSDIMCINQSSYRATENAISAWNRRATPADDLRRKRDG